MTDLFAIASILSLALIAFVCGLHLMTQAARVAFSRRGFIPPPPPAWSRSPRLELTTFSEREQAEAKTALYPVPGKLAQKRARMPQDETDRIRLAGAGNVAGTPKSA